MNAETAALQAWFDLSISNRDARVGKGRVSHFSTGNDETLCGKLVGTYLTRGDALDMSKICDPCWNKATKLGAEALATKEEAEMPAKKKTAETPAVETPAEPTPEQREEFDALIERITAVAITEPGSEALDALMLEAEALVTKFPAGETAKLRAQYRKAAAAKPTVPTAHPASTEVAVIETEDYTKIKNVVDLVNMGAGKVSEGITLAKKASVTAREVATVLFDMRLHLANKQGVPDLKCASHEAKRASSDMYEAAKAAMPDDPDFDRDAAIKSLMRAVNFQMSDVVVGYVRALDNSPEELGPFAKVLEAHPNLSPSEAVRAFYKISDKSEIEKARERRELASAAAAASDTEGEGDGEKGSGDAVQSDAEKLIALLDKCEKFMTSVVKGAGKLEDDEKASVKDRLSKLLDTGALGKAKL